MVLGEFFLLRQVLSIPLNHNIPVKKDGQIFKVIYSTSAKIIVICNGQEFKSENNSRKTTVKQFMRLFKLWINDKNNFLLEVNDPRIKILQ